jgi:hypothetical protein
MRDENDLVYSLSLFIHSHAFDLALNEALKYYRVPCRLNLKDPHATGESVHPGCAFDGRKRSSQADKRSEGDSDQS